MLSALGKDRDYVRQCHTILVIPRYCANWLIEFYWLTVQLGGHMNGNVGSVIILLSLMELDWS